MLFGAAASCRVQAHKDAIILAELDYASRDMCSQQVYAPRGLLALTGAKEIVGAIVAARVQAGDASILETGMSRASICACYDDICMVNVSVSHVNSGVASEKISY